MWSLYVQVISKFNDFRWEALNQIEFFSIQNLIYWILMALLLILNWTLEAKKWHLLALKIENISFIQAFKGVLVGLAFSNLFFSIGDFAGKILMLQSNKRFQSIGAVLLGNSMQLYVSLLFGFIGLLSFVMTQNPSPKLIYNLLLFILGVCILAGVLIGKYLPEFNQIKHTKNSFIAYLKVLGEFKPNEIYSIFILSFIRYLVFSSQFYLVFVIFQVKLPIYVLLSGIFLIFLGKTIGSLLNALGDLSVRTLSATYFFSFYKVDIYMVYLATFTVWLINVFVPILLGSIYLFQLKFSTPQLHKSK